MISNIPWDFLLYVTTRQSHIREREFAIATSLITESDAGVQTDAGQACTLFVTHRTLVIIEVRMTLDNYEKDEKLNWRDKNTPHQG